MRALDRRGVSGLWHGVPLGIVLEPLPTRLVSFPQFCQSAPSSALIPERRLWRYLLPIPEGVTRPRSAALRLAVGRSG